MLRREPLACDQLQRFRQLRDRGRRQRHAGRVAVSAESGEMLRAARQRVVQMESFHAASGSLRDAAFLLAEHQRRPVEAFDQTARDDARHAEVPAARRHDQSAPVPELPRLRASLLRDARLQLLPLGVSAIELFGQRARLAGISSEE